MKYKFLLAVMLLLSGCSTPPKKEVNKETPSVSFEPLIFKGGQ